MFRQVSDDSLHFDLTLHAMKAASAHQSLEQAARACAAKTGLDADRLYRKLLARENLASSGIGDGVAIPHLKLAGLKQPFTLFASLARPVDFDAVDGQPVELLILLLSPEEDEALHLRRLARVSRLMRDDHLRDCLLSAESPDALEALLLGWRAMPKAA